MARKVSDMVLLLGSRGRPRSRGRSGFAKSSLGQVLAGAYRAVFGRSRSERPTGSSGLVLGAVALLCFAGGYLTGGHFMAPRSAEAAELQAGGTKGNPKAEQRAPGVIGEIDTKPKSSQALIVAAYEGVAPEEARQQAVALTEYLQRKHKLTNAKPYEAKTPQGSLWLVVVYYGSEAEKARSREQLLLLPADVPDEHLVRMRREGRDSENGWPIPWSVQ